MIERLNFELSQSIELSARLTAVILNPTRGSIWNASQVAGGGHFETPKEYGRHCHRYLGKIEFFMGHLDHKKVPKMRILFRASFKRWVKIISLHDILRIL